jgi:hypothetical protein
VTQQTCVKAGGLELDTTGLVCPHCKYRYSPEATDKMTSHKSWTGLIKCERCVGVFEWIRSTRVFYSSKALPHGAH